MQDNKLAIIIVVWNRSDLITTQVELLRRFCKDDDYEIIVVDNSTDMTKSAEVRNHANAINCTYIKTNTALHTSQSHAYAANYAYQSFKQSYEYMLFLDHDNFPIKDFSVKSILNGRVIGGVGQTKPTKTYLWPGCVLINNKLIDQSIVDFSTNSQLGLDTGGNLYKVLERHGLHNCVFFDQFEIKNALYDKIEWGAYNIQCTQPGDSPCSFMHFLNASNWGGSQYNEERINSLMTILKNYVAEELAK